MRFATGSECTLSDIAGVDGSRARRNSGSGHHISKKVFDPHLVTRRAIGDLTVKTDGDVSPVPKIDNTGIKSLAVHQLEVSRSCSSAHGRRRLKNESNDHYEHCFR